MPEMSSDPLLPIAPARVRALLLPIGQIKAARFASFAERLQNEHVVHLRDITADGRPNRNMFSPLAFPSGAIFYELITYMPSPAHLALSPFDLYREPLVVLAVADGAELDKVAFGRRQSAMGTGLSLIERNIRGLSQELEDLRDQYPKALVHNILIFDYAPPDDHHIPIPEGLVTIPPPAKSKRTTMKTVICDVSSLLLAEMTTLAKSYEAMSYIESPGQGLMQPPEDGPSWGPEDPASQLRRNSSYGNSATSRSSSASGILDRAQARMSMPAVKSPSGSLDASSVRSSTPVGRSGLSNVVNSSNGMENGTGNEMPNLDEKPLPSRPGTSEGMRSQSADRVSVQGFGPGGLNERWRNKGKGRVTIVIGSLYLQAGRWTDALKDLIDGATAAKSINDHIWHGKALELILLCLLFLGWVGLEFQLPIICLPPPEKGSGLNGPPNFEKTDPKQPKWMQQLQTILPELLERIIGLYSRISAEHLPPVAHAETVVRFSKIQSALHVADGQLGEKALNMIIFGKYPRKQLSTSPRVTITPSRSYIINSLFRAFPASTAQHMDTADRAVILSGIASVLGVLGFHRKKAFVVRELVSVLIGGLVEARTRGAAEVGIHPAAGLVALNSVNSQSNGAGALELGEGDIEHGVDAFLGLLLKTYGIVSHDMDAKSLQDGQTLADDSDESVVTRIQKQSAARFFGMQNVKLNILWACINFSEALPDFQGVLRYSSDLLRTAGSGVAAGRRRDDAAPVITREEQVRLVTNISKTSSLTKRLGLGHLAAEYWDEFLVRGIKLDPLAATRTPVPHAKSILPGVTTARASQDVNPFIYNPFLKEPDAAAVEHTLVAGETAIFRLTLQNPYEIEVEIESIRLEAEGVEFESAVESTVIGPYRTQILKVGGTPKAGGDLKITGAIVRVRGCRERRFPIFSQPWVPAGEAKVKSIGLFALERNMALKMGNKTAIKSDCLDLNVIPPQPVVVVKSTTLHQSSVMILEGERQAFSVTLQNLSAETPADFLLFSFQDSTQEPLQTALNNRDASAAELYEYELILAQKQAFRLKKKKAEGRYIAPGGTATFEFEVLGKPGLTNGVIQVDYAHLGVPHDEVGDKFHTRQVSQRLTVTVNASVELARMDMLPLHNSIPRPLWSRMHQLDEHNTDLTPDKYCLLMLDLRNAWPGNMSIQLKSENGAAVEENILPGHTTRVIMPFEKVYLEDPHASIPALNPARQRQFIVSTGKVTPDGERSNREAFWYRERILNMLKGSWKAVSGPQKAGEIDLRSLRLTPRMVEAIKIDEVGIEISVGAPGDSEAGGRNTVYVDEFVRIKVHVTNRTEKPIHPLLRLMPALCHRPPNVALDFTRKLACNGTLQQVLPMLDAKSSAEVDLGVTMLCRGVFDITASVEETRLWKPAEGEENKRGSGRPRSDTQKMMDAVLGAEERRIWHSRQPCVVLVKDRE